MPRKKLKCSEQRERYLMMGKILKENVNPLRSKSKQKLRKYGSKKEKMKAVCYEMIDRILPNDKENFEVLYAAFSGTLILVRLLYWTRSVVPMCKKARQAESLNKLGQPSSPKRNL